MRLVREGVHAALASLVLMIAGCGGPPALQSSEDELSFHQKPQIVIDSPSLGGFVATSKDGTVEVSGHTRGSSLTINGRPVAVDSSGAFKSRIPATPGINFITARLNSLWGGEAQRAFVYGDFAPPAAPLRAAVQVRATAAAYDDKDGELDDFSTIAKAMLAQTDVMKYLKDLPPITYGFGIGSVDISVAGVDFAKDKTVLGLSPKAVGAHLDGSFTNLVLNLDLVIHLLGDHPATATVSVDTVGFIGDLIAKFSATAQLPDPNNPGGYITGPGIEGSMAKPDIALGNLTISTDASFPGADQFITWLANHFRSQIAAEVAKQIQESAANHYAEALNQLGFPSSFDLKPLGVNASIAITDAFDGLTSFDDLGATISATTGFGWPSLAPGAPGAGAPGSLLVHSGGTAQFPAATFGVSMSFDAMNQAAFAVWGQGALQRVVYPAKDYRIFKLDAVVATPQLPPVLLPGNGSHLQLALGDIVVTTALHTFFFDGPVRVTVSAVADVALDIDPANGALRMTISGKPTIFLDVNDLLGIVPDAFLLPLSEALQAIAPTIVANVVKPMEFPLPGMPLANLIQGSTATLALAAPINVSVDAGAKRVTVSGDLALRK